MYLTRIFLLWPRPQVEKSRDVVHNTAWVNTGFNVKLFSAATWIPMSIVLPVLPHIIHRFRMSQRKRRRECSMNSWFITRYYFKFSNSIYNLTKISIFNNRESKTVFLRAVSMWWGTNTYKWRANTPSVAHTAAPKLLIWITHLVSLPCITHQIHHRRRQSEWFT